MDGNVSGEGLLIAVKVPEASGGMMFEVAAMDMYVTRGSCDDDGVGGSALYENDDTIAPGP
jgi:hypothetical protein